MRLGSTSSSGEYWQQGYSYIHGGAAGTTNNGNIKQITQTFGSTTINTNYAYDSINRLCNAAENGSGAAGSCTAAFVSPSWQQRYDYDAQGNRTITASTLAPTSYTASTFNASNRITNSGFTYDDRGNLNGMPGSTSTDKFFFDAEDRQITYCPTTTVACADNASGGNRTIYGYDAEGKRVTKQSLVNGNVRYIYDGHGNLALEDGAVTPVIGITYLTRDHLGSVRVSSGSVLERHDYLPFGEEISVSSGNPRFEIAGYGVDQVARQKFTGKERDTETGLDYFGARYMSSAQGRFTSPDTPLAYSSPDNPQTWNLYSYVGNNPLRTVDLDGHCGLDWNCWSEFGSGVADASYRPIVQAVSHPINTISNVASALAHPINTATAVKNAVMETTNAALSGDPNAIGKVVGTALSAAATAGAGKAATSAIQGARTTEAAVAIANPLSGTLARVIPAGIETGTLGAPGVADVFVTNAAELSGLNAGQIADRKSVV